MLIVTVRHLVRRAATCRMYATKPTASTVTNGGGLKIAVIGSGPAGLYSCSALLSRLPDCELHVLDRSAAPYGLVSFGVAPDHADMKRCAHQFERMFEANADRLSLFGNVSVGTDVSYEELCSHYDAIVLAYGASRARRLELPNAEERFNCHSGYSFVSWYNGQPNTTSENLRLDGANAVIVGNGNVAIDCARLLLSDAERFRFTDIPDYAFQVLRRSAVRRVQMLGRRGPSEASFTIKELRELLTLETAEVYCSIHPRIVDEHRAQLDGADASAIPRRRRRILELMLANQQTTRHGEDTVADTAMRPTRRTGSIVFHRQPERVQLNADGTRIASLLVRDTISDVVEELPCDLLIYAIGFTEFHLPGVPRADDGERLRLRDWCRVDEARANVYATGWCAQAGSGVIADTQRNAALVADEVCADWKSGRLERKTTRSTDDVRTLLRRAGIRYVSWRDWKHVDQAERERGTAVGKPREKIADVLKFLQERETSK